MKQITRNFTTTELITIAALIIVSAIIWFAGPHLVVGNHLPLLDPEKRFAIIMVLFLGWMILSLVFSLPQHTTPVAPTYTSESIKKQEALQGRFQGAVDFLKKTLINKQGHEINLSHLPWYVFIGPQHSGKTTLLANADIQFILTKQFKPEILKSIPPSEACDWWVTRDLVLVDIPSSYIQAKEKTDQKNSPRASLHNVLWSNLLNLIKNHRKQESLNGIIIALHLPELMQPQNSQQQKTVVPDIKQRTHELRAKFGKDLPCYFIITKCDLIPGFIEFFGENGSDELAQAWGITLTALKPNEKLSDALAQRFNALIKRLNKQLLWRLHQERNPQARTAIKDFPLHMERVKDAMLHFMKAFGVNDLHLNGVFFTSAIQSDDEPAGSPLTINQVNQQALQILQEPPAPSKPYFVRQLITQGLLHTPPVAPVATSTSALWQRRAAYAASVVTIALSAIFLGYDFKQGTQQAYQIQNNLTQYQFYMQQANDQGDRLTRALPLLNALQEAAQSQGHKSRIINFLSFYSNRSQQTADEVYAKALETIVLPSIKNNLEKSLQTTDEKNPAQLYAALKAYLMLSDSEHFQATFIANTIKQLFASTLTKEAADQLSAHISTTLSSSHSTALQLDGNLIAQARKKLASLPSIELGYVILKNTADNNLDSAIKLGTDSENSPVFISKALVNQMPNMFTANGIKIVLSGEIPTAASEALQGNWIIGALAPSTQDATALAEQIRMRYLTNYVDVWESQLANIHLYAPKDLTELGTMLDTLTSNNSPLLQMLQSIQQNTAFEIITNASPKLQALNTLLANASNDQNNLLYQMFLNLRELDLFVKNITHASNMGNAAFQATKQHILPAPEDPIAHINTLAQEIQDPMKTWLTNLSAQSWTLISRTAVHYVDNAWQKNIITTYHSQIADRFPFARNATQEVPLQSFITFLGQQGTLSSFYQTYLKPFVDDSKDEWHWRTIDNQPLPFKNDVLVQLQNIGKIQRAFFPNGDNHLYVQFTLQTVSLEPSIKSFNLSINGQQINYQLNDPTTPRSISWPGNNNTTHATTMNFVTPENKLISNTLPGDWGWFRLVNKATQSVNTRKELLLNFDVDGHTARYLLFTQGHMNPFLPLNLEKFQLPDNLV